MALDFELGGIGLHSGAPARVRVCAAPPGHGRVFVRMDLDQAPIPARSEQVSATTLATTLTSSSGRASVSTVEHLLASAYALGIDNLLVQVWGPEIPVLDGSAQPWLERMAPERQGLPAEVLEVLEPVELRDGVRWMRLLPAPSLALDVEIRFEHFAIGTQRWQGGAGDFGQIASARTFGFQDQVQAMHQAGLALGGSLDNAVVFGDSGPLNALRFPDEPVRHKALDLFGDLALMGCRLQGQVQAHRPGHGMTHALLKQLWASPSAWRMVQA
ncbi:MAG: UDP-3-O-[3-hydroxymyristoyl] N-acetylglucosamine deacetylase [Cognaticolwellia sp.]